MEVWVWVFFALGLLSALAAALFGDDEVVRVVGGLLAIVAIMGLFIIGETETYNVQGNRDDLAGLTDKYKDIRIESVNDNDRRVRYFQVKDNAYCVGTYKIEGEDDYKIDFAKSLCREKR